MSIVIETLEQLERLNQQNQTNHESDPVVEFKPAPVKSIKGFRISHFLIVSVLILMTVALWFLLADRSESVSVSHSSDKAFSSENSFIKEPKVNTPDIPGEGDRIADSGSSALIKDQKPLSRYEENSLESVFDTLVFTEIAGEEPVDTKQRVELSKKKKKKLQIENKKKTTQQSQRIQKAMHVQKKPLQTNHSQKNTETQQLERSTVNQALPIDANTVKDSGLIKTGRVISRDLMQRVSAAVEAGRFQAAVEELERNQAGFDADWRYWYWMGYSHLALGHWHRAEQSLVNAIEYNPDIGDVWIKLGLAYQQQDQLEKAVYAFKTALEKDGNNPSAFFNLAYAYDQAGLYSESIRYYGEFVRTIGNDKQYTDLQITALQRVSELSRLGF